MTIESILKDIKPKREKEKVIPIMPGKYRIIGNVKNATLSEVSCVAGAVMIEIGSVAADTMIVNEVTPIYENSKDVCLTKLTQLRKWLPCKSCAHRVFIEPTGAE